MKKQCSYYVLFSLVLVLFAQSAWGSSAVEDLDWYPALHDALESGMLHVGDITVKRDYIKADPFRLKIGIDWLEKPFLIPSRMEEIARSFSESKKLADIFDAAALLKDNSTLSFEYTPPAPSVELFHRNLEELAKIDDVDLEVSIDDLKKLLEGIPGPVINALCVLTGGAVDAHKEAEKAYEDLTESEIEYLMDNISKITTEGQVPSPEMPEKLYGYVKRVNQQHIANAAKIMCVATDLAREQLDKVGPEWLEELNIDDMTFLKIDTVFGIIIVGGTGRNTYREDAFIIIDLGGNDEYRSNCSSVTEKLNASSVIIDLSGNDLYHTDENYSIAASICGYAILVDEDGDDEYTGVHHSQASGTLGLGMLVDKAGIDRYFADTASQATGYFGYGILVDIEGNDFYTAHMNSQAHAQVNGAAFLLDFGGNDMYITGNKYKDYRQGQKYYGTLSQGFAIGARPNYSAGIGGLFDFDGNDNYICDVFGQGSSYWFGVGILYDEAGDDRYIARRYAQGAGIHLSTGLLMDMSGNDRYTSWGVSQGCGHDISQGMLFDASGNDSYYAEWLSQGAGNANGYGILIDLDGNDKYVADGGNAQGAGTFQKKEDTYSRARGYTSVGILIDANGKDEYNQGGEDNSFWRNGYFGVGYDTTRPVDPNDNAGGSK